MFYNYNIVSGYLTLGIGNSNQQNGNNQEIHLEGNKIKRLHKNNAK